MGARCLRVSISLYNPLLGAGSGYRSLWLGDSRYMGGVPCGGVRWLHDDPCDIILIGSATTLAAAVAMAVRSSTTDACIMADVAIDAASCTVCNQSHPPTAGTVVIVGIRCQQTVCYHWHCCPSKQPATTGRDSCRYIPRGVFCIALSRTRPAAPYTEAIPSP